MNIERTHIKYSGEFRHLHVDRYCLDTSPKGAVVMATAFIENAYWYQIEKQDYSLARRIAQEGYDVYVLSFVMQKDRLSDVHLPSDCSFNEIVTQQLPKFHQLLVERYEDIHYVGHSYGVTILLSFLLGYQKNSEGAFIPDEIAVKENTHKVKSFTSISGLFKLAWPHRTKLPSLEGLRTWIYPLLDKGARAPFAKVKSILPVLPTRILSLVRFLPTRAPASLFLRVFENIGLMPSFHFANADLQALQFALSKGTSDESLETFMTVLNLHPRFEKSKSRNRALNHFTEDLAKFGIPILFLQGELDQVTHPEIIRRYGFRRVGSPKKKFTILKNTGHQDILTAKNPHKLFLEIKNWLSEF